MKTVRGKKINHYKPMPLGEQSASKTDEQGSNPCRFAARKGSPIPLGMSIMDMALIVPTIRVWWPVYSGCLGIVAYRCQSVGKYQDAFRSRSLMKTLSCSDRDGGSNPSKTTFGFIV